MVSSELILPGTTNVCYEPEPDRGLLTWMWSCESFVGAKIHEILVFWKGLVGLYVWISGASFVL
jgi:hypothetical protein